MNANEDTARRFRLGDAGRAMAGFISGRAVEGRRADSAGYFAAVYGSAEAWARRAGVVVRHSIQGGAHGRCGTCARFAVAYAGGDRARRSAGGFAARGVSDENR